MNTQRQGWDFTVLFSNTQRAHELGKTRDWVVIYYEGDNREGQSTVITAQRGPLRGHRIIRGREAECRRYYDQREDRPSPGS
jgi:DNA polymerase (family X)